MDAFHTSVALLDVVAVERRPAGTDGASASGVPPPVPVTRDSPHLRSASSTGWKIDWSSAPPGPHEDWPPECRPTALSPASHAPPESPPIEQAVVVARPSTTVEP